MRRLFILLLAMAIAPPLSETSHADPLPPSEYAKRVRQQKKKKETPKDGDKSKAKDGGDAKPGDKGATPPAKGS